VERLKQHKRPHLVDNFNAIFLHPEVTLDHLCTYIESHLNFTHTLLYPSLKTIICDAQHTSPLKITKEAISSALQIQVELSVPFSAFLHVGVNGLIDHFNNENQFYERVFYAYSRAVVEAGEEPNHQGLSFE